MTARKAYSLKSAAEACDVSTDTIKRAIAAGNLEAKALSIGKDGNASKRVILEAELDRWLTSLESA